VNEDRRAFWEDTFTGMFEAAERYDRVAFGAPQRGDVPEADWQELDPVAAAKQKQARIARHWQREHEAGNYGDWLNTTDLGRRILHKRRDAKMAAPNVTQAQYDRRFMPYSAATQEHTGYGLPQPALVQPTKSQAIRGDGPARSLRNLSSKVKEPTPTTVGPIDAGTRARLLSRLDVLAASDGGRRVLRQAFGTDDVDLIRQQRPVEPRPEPAWNWARR